MVERRTWVNIAVRPCLHSFLTHNKHHLFENKVWEIYIFRKKCIRSLLKSSLSVDNVPVYICIRVVYYTTWRPAVTLAEGHHISWHWCLCKRKERWHSTWYQCVCRSYNVDLAKRIQHLILNSESSFPWLVALLRLKNSVYPSINPEAGREEIDSLYFWGYYFEVKHTLVCIWTRLADSTFYK